MENEGGRGREGEEGRERKTEEGGGRRHILYGKMQ